MDDLLAAALDPGVASDQAALLRLLGERARDPTLATRAVHLLVENRIVEAYFLAQLFRRVGVTSAPLALALAAGGFLLGNEADTEEGTRALAPLVDAMRATMRDWFARTLAQPVVARLMMGDASLTRPDQARRALRLVELYKAGFAEFRAIFDWTAAPPAPTRDALVAQGRSRANLLSFEGPPLGVKRKRKAVVAFRRFVFPQDPTSRQHESGMRAAAALKAYGWETTHYQMHFAPEIDYRDIAALCDKEKPDILFLDDFLVVLPASHRLRVGLIAGLRARLPELKIVAVHLDPWAIEERILVETAAPADAVWAPISPSTPAWANRSLAGKVMLVPFPHGLEPGRPRSPLPDKMVFSGGISAQTWHRALWLAGIERGMPYSAQISTDAEDGLSVSESYAAYMKRIEASGCVLNFSMRPDLSRIYTWRSFEAPLAGALLVQEEAPDMDRYFVAGEHYLSFRTAPELRALARFIAERPDEAEQIRRDGNAFARSRYSDEKLISYIDRAIFYPPY